MKEFKVNIAVLYLLHYHNFIEGTKSQGTWKRMCKRTKIRRSYVSLYSCH